MEDLRSEIRAADQRIARDKLAKFKGTARVSIIHLDFPRPSRQVEKKVIDQLIRDFDGEGCIREEPSHRIPAMIEDSVLAVALRKLSISAEMFKVRGDIPPTLQLESGVKLECLHGQHRILAAKEYFVLRSERWWIVDLYGTG